MNFFIFIIIHIIIQMSSIKFNNQLKIGQAYELLTIQLLNITDYETTQDKGNFKKYDIKGIYDGKKSKFEIKADGQVEQYYNFYIEYASGFGEDCNKSGITATESDYYVYYARKFNKKDKQGKEIFDVGNPPQYYRYYIIPTKVLDDYIKKNNHKLRSIRGGDFKRSLGYLVPEKDFSKYLHLP
jgi:hypothetical protein